MEAIDQLEKELTPKDWDLLQQHRCETDLTYLCRDILGMSDWDECHDRLLEWKYEHRNRRFKMVLMPRGFMKSSVLTIGETVQDILNDFNTRILLSSAVWNNSRSFLREIADPNMGYLTNKSILPLIYGEFISEKWNQEEIIIRQRSKPNKTPTLDTAGIDKVLTSQHYRKIKVDDAVTRETTTTKEQIEKVINHFKDLLKLLDPDGTMDIIGTRWDDQDAYRWVLESLTKAELGDEAFVVYKTGPLDEAGRPIFPKKFSIQVLANLKTKIGSYEFSCNMENDPTSPTNRIFQPPTRYWDSLPEELSHVITVDPAISVRHESSDAVVVDTAESRAGQLFVVEYTAFQGADKHPGKIIDKIIEYLLRFGPNVCGIEAVNYQEVLCTLLKDELKKRDLKMEVAAIHQNEDKARRIICLQASWERGDFLIKRGSSELEEQIDKFRKPIVAKCDILDAIAMRKQIPQELITFKNARSRSWVHPAHRVNGSKQNPYAGRALPEKDWNKLNAGVAGTWRR